MNPKTRSFEITLDIDAPRDAVWDALTKAEELVRWFPLQADVTPGDGGQMTWTWESSWKWVSRIDAWQPGKMLRLVDRSAMPFDADGRPVDKEAAAPANVAMTFTLETVDGKTRLHLVHSGFGSGAAWDDEIDGISHGWPFELRSLRQYLTRFRGKNRSVAHAHRAAPVSLADVWPALVTPGVIEIVADSFVEGSPYRAALATGDTFSGTVQLYIPQRAFAGTARELGGGLFRVGTYAAGGPVGLTVFAATYDAAASEPMAALERRMQTLIDGLFAGR